MAKKSSVQVNITIPLEWKQSDIEMVAKARAWAVKAHAGQKDKAGKDYKMKAGKAHGFNRGMIGRQ